MWWLIASKKRFRWPTGFWSLNWITSALAAQDRLQKSRFRASSVCGIKSATNASFTRRREKISSRSKRFWKNFRIWTPSLRGSSSHWISWHVYEESRKFTRLYYTYRIVIVKTVLNSLWCYKIIFDSIFNNLNVEIVTIFADQFYTAVKRKLLIYLQSRLVRTVFTFSSLIRLVGVGSVYRNQNDVPITIKCIDPFTRFQ